MKTLVSKIQKFPSESILLFNLALLALAILLSDPFQIFVNKYSDASPFLKLGKEEQIEKIRISKPGSQTVFFELSGLASLPVVKKQNGAEVLANPSKIFALKEDLQSIRKFTLVSKDLKNAENYGFGLDSIFVTIQTNQKELVLEVGNSRERSNDTFLREYSQAEVYVVPNALRNSLGRGEEDLFFEKNLFPFADSDISALSLSSTGNSFTCVKEDFVWKKVSGNIRVLSKGEIETLLSRISNLNASKVFTDLSELDSPIISKDQFLLRVKAKDKDYVMESLGRTKDKAMIVKLNSRREMFRIEEYQVENLTSTKIQ